VRLEQRSEARHVGRVADHDGVWVADVDDDELDPSDRLPRSDAYLAELLLDLVSAEHARDDLARPDA
jgi:hypothetical protein